MAVLWPFCPPFECRFSQKFINDEPVLKSVDCGTPKTTSKKIAS